jgi:DNA-binding IclR family transcriptional regulator
MQNSELKKTEKAKNESSGRGGIQVIARAAHILRTLQNNPDGLSLGQIAKQVDLPRSTVQRIVDALNQENLIFLSCKNGVRLGPALLSLAKATRFKIAKLARPTLDVLAKETKETAKLALVDIDKVVFVDQVLGSQPVITMSELGVSMPLHSTASGKALLAGMHENELAKLKKRLKLTKQTKNTVTSWSKLDKEITQIRETGLAFEYEETTLGICAVSTTFISPTDAMGAISISVPTQRFISDKDYLSQTLYKHCHPLRIE